MTELRRPGPRRAIVTGGCSGLGAAVAERLTADGIQVTTWDVSDSADVVVDVADDAAVAAAAAASGAVDVLVNSAGIVGPNATLCDTPVSEWDRTLAINLRGTFLACAALIPGMVDRGWGRVVNISSMAGKDGNPRLSAYSASKAGVIALTKSLGKEVARSGVLVNAIAPAVIDTPMNAGTSPEVLAHLASLIPMGRVGTSAEVAELVAWLCSERCSFSTGAVYDISGGRATY